ncbi:MAG: aldo/keto reductase [Caldilineaceae bacterium]|nr:aldo/keto reductase [Caldilineaceae bacterium]
MQTVKLLDGTSLPVLGLGTWSYGGGNTPDYSRDAESIATMRTIIGMGYTHLDTAESYGKNHCEEIVGQAIKAFDRSDIFITTKVAPEHLRALDVIKAAEGSLRRLDVDAIDLYLIHWPNKDIPLNETFAGLNKLLGDGRVKRVGLSNFSVEQMRESMRLCDGPIITNQVKYNLLHREPENNGVLDFCQQEGIVLTAYSPLKSDVMDHPVVKRIAAAHNATPAQVAIQWLVRQPLVITIPKSSDIDHAKENLGALDVALTEAEVAELDAISG